MIIKRLAWTYGAFLLGICAVKGATMENDVVTESATENDLVIESTTKKDWVIQPYIEYTLEAFQNVKGGLHREGAIMGLLDFWFEADLERLMKWKGATFVVSAFSGQGPDFSARNTGDFGVVSNIYHDGDFNIYNIYLQQMLGEGGSYLKLGQIAADDEFMGSDTAGVFINSVFGPLNTQSGNMGAPIFPYAAPGAVVHIQPGGAWFLTTGIYAGVLENGQLHNIGFDWRIGGGAGVAVFAEGGFLYDEAESVIKLGGYYHTGEFEDFATGAAVDGLGAVYAIFDHRIYDAGEGGVQLDAFWRGSLVTDNDRAVAVGYLDAGVSATGLGHDEAILGLGVSYTLFGDDYRAATPGVSQTETVIELTYQYPLFSHLSLQPDIQYIIDPHEAGDDALVLGMRAALSF